MSLTPDGVQAVGHLHGTKDLLVQGRQNALRFRRVEGCAGTLPAHIRDQEGQASVRQGEDIEIVSRHLAGREDGGPHRGYPQGLKIGQQPHLHLPGDPKLLFHPQAFLPLCIRPLEARGHLVEGRGELRHLILAPRTDAHGKITPAEPFHTPVQVVDRPSEGPGQDQSEDGRHRLGQGQGQQHQDNEDDGLHGAFG